MSIGLDIGQLLEYLSAHDGRPVDLVSVSSWHEQAVRGAWTREAVRTAAVEHYSADPPVCWPDTDRPRPLLPVDVNRRMTDGG